MDKFLENWVDEVFEKIKVGGNSDDS